MRGYTERPNLISAAALVVGGQATFKDQFPMGEGWFHMRLGINIVLTNTTGTTPVTEGELLLLKNVFLKTDRGEIVCNLPGRALWKIAAMKNGALPSKDAISATAGTFRVDLPIYFCDPEGGPLQMLRPEDTLLDTSRYNSVTLQITIGTVADLLSVVGDSAITVNMDVEVERTFGRVPGMKPGEGGKPIAFINYDSEPPVDANTTTNVNIERSSDLSLKRIFLHTCSSGTAGVPWSGTNANDRIATLTVKDQSRFIEATRVYRQIQNQNKLDCMLETLLAGVALINFVADKSIASALSTGDKSVLQATWVNGTVAANSLVTLTREGIRNLK